MLLTMVSQNALAQLKSIRAEDPVSVMVELSVGGPNGTIGTHVDYDFLEWGGVSLGVGFSGISQSVNTSLMFNARVLRGGSYHHEGAFQLSLGASYRGQSEREEQTLWGDETNIYKADQTLFISSSVGYALAHRGGWRFHVYLGWEFPVFVSNYERFKRYEDGETVEIDQSKDHGSKISGIGFPSIGFSIGQAF
jgi:hypothetical protein